MKQRSLLTATQVNELHEFLGRRLEAIGIESQPEIVIKLLDLSKNSNAQLKEYAGVIKTDHAISGRVLKLANSAMFAQRTAVTNIERACTLLGIERLKSVSLGFHLSRAASAKDAGLKEVARKVWGQSVFRACMAAEASKTIAPGYASEAFIIGLMMDAAIPLCAKILGESFLTIFVDCPGPGKLFRREHEQLGFTHVDVVSVLAKRWRFPELLARPLELHHTRPADNARDDVVSRLHRIAYVVGLLELEPTDLSSPSMLAATSAGGGMQTAQRLLHLTDEEMARLVKASVGEYRVLSEVFSEIASELPDIDELANRVHNGLLACLDQQMEEAMERELSAGTSGVVPAQTVLTINKVRIEIVRDTDGCVIAFVSDAAGKRVVSHRLAIKGDTPQNICEQLGVDTPSAEDALRINARISALAA